MTKTDFKIACDVIEKEKDFLKNVSMQIWNKPELCYEETHAHEVLTNALDKYGFRVQRSYLLETAFRAEYLNGTDGPTVAVLCEYDALPEIGHGCGHNLIAEAGLAAGIAIKTIMESDPTIHGKVIVMGCPAEEDGGGKIRLIEKGAFKGVDIAIMAHPSKDNILSPNTTCRLKLDVTFMGKETHAASYPWEGLNALDAAVCAYVNIGLLRQQVKPACRFHGIISNGGAAPNIIPDKTELKFYVRAPTVVELTSLKKRIGQCFESAAHATGCQVKIDFHDDKTHYNVIANKTLKSLYKKHTSELGFQYPAEITSSASTDMGNVSYVVPAIHPIFSIGPYLAHSREFTQAASTDIAHEAARTAAKGLALTAIDILRSPDLLKQCEQHFQEDIAEMNC